MKGYTIPIYYHDGRIGYGDEVAAYAIANGIILQDQAYLTPEDRNKYMGRPRKNKVNAVAQNLSAALSFVNMACRDTGAPYQNHCRIGGKMITQFDGVIAAGHPIAEELSACPHTARMLTAVDKCGLELQIGETPGGQLSIKGEKLTALVPCLPPEEMPQFAPDWAMVPIDNYIKAGFDVLNKLIAEGADLVVDTAILLQGNTMVATDRTALIEYWHGWNLPPNLVLPKQFVQAVVKCDKKLVQFGYTEGRSITFFYEDGAWIKTQLYVTEYPHYQGLLNVPFNPVVAPVNFFEAADTVRRFNDNEEVILRQGYVASHSSSEAGAYAECPGVMENGTFTAKHLKQIADVAKRIDFSYQDRLYYDGERCRGVIAGLKRGE